MKEENDYRCCRKQQQKYLFLLRLAGISSVKDMYNLLRAGADKVSINSAAVRNPKLIEEGAEHFGSQCIVVAIDARKVAEGKWNVYVNGGRVDTGMDAIEWAKRVVKLGAGEILLTSMDADGTKSGYDLRLTEEISKVFLFQSSHQEAVVIRIIL